MIGLDGVTHVHVRHGSLGQRGFNLQHGRRFRFGLLLRITQQFQHPRHVLTVVLAQSFRFLVIAKIVVALRQSQPTLQCRGNHLRAVLSVLIGREAKHHAHTLLLQPRGQSLQPPRILYFGNALERDIDRFSPSSVDSRGIHTARVEVAHFSFIRARRSVGFFGGLQNLPQRLLVFVRQHRKRAPTRVLRRNRIALHPAAHRELEKIVAGLAALI